MFVPTIEKMTVNFAANDDIGEISFKELSKLAEKRKWQTRFANDYKGELKAMNDEIFTEGIVKCIVAVEQGDKEIGYMRIADVTVRFEACNDGAWSLQDAYVKPAYRKRKVMLKMIKHAVDNLHVKLICITHDRYFDNRYYYGDLGFNNFIFVDDTYLGYLVHDSYTELIEKLHHKAA